MILRRSSDVYDLDKGAVGDWGRGGLVRKLSLFSHELPGSLRVKDSPEGWIAHSAERSAVLQDGHLRESNWGSGLLALQRLPRKRNSGARLNHHGHGLPGRGGAGGAPVPPTRPMGWAGRIEYENPPSSVTCEPFITVNTSVNNNTNILNVPNEQVAMLSKHILM